MKYYEIKHSGIKGQKWGVRKYQNPDGTLTPEGKIRYKGYKGSLRKRIDSGENARQVVKGEQIKNTKTAMKGIGAYAAGIIASGAAAAAGFGPVAIGSFAAGVVAVGTSFVKASAKNITVAEISNEYDLADLDVNNRQSAKGVPEGFRSMEEYKAWKGY